MMPSPRDVGKRLRRVAKRMVDLRKTEALTIATEQIALLRDRWAKGENSDGQLFAKYAPSTVRQRTARGAQTSHVDFNLTGDMYKSLYPKIIKHNAHETVVRIMARGNDNELKLRTQSTKGKPPRGNILQPSQFEIDIMRRANQKRVARAFSLD